MQGIQSLDPSQQMAPAQGSNPAAPQQLDQVIQKIEASLPPQLVSALQGVVQKISSLEPQDLKEFSQIIDLIIQNKDNYPQVVQQLIASGKVQQGDLPPQYDEALFTAIKQIITVATTSAQGQQPAMPPQRFATGGIATLQEAGRGRDTMLAHITPHEAALLHSYGGSGRINPNTGLHEFGFDFGSIFKAIAPVIGAVAGSFLPLGDIVGTAAASFIGPAIGSFAVSKLAGNSTQDALLGAVISGGVGYAAGNTQAANLGGYGKIAGQSLGSSIYQGISAPEGGVGSLFKFGQVAPAASVAAATPPPTSSPTPIASPQTAAAQLATADINKVLTPEQIRALPQDQLQAYVDRQALLQKAGAAGSSGMLGGIGDFVKNNAFPVAAGLSALASLDRQQAPEPLGYKQTSADLVKANPKAYLFDPRKFGVTDPAALARYDEQIAAQPPVTAAHGGQIDASIGGHLHGPGTGTSDSIPAKLSDGEFVMTARAVRGAGGGDRKAGARRMYEIMHEFEKRA